jgi:hypothetical protein
MKDVTRHYRPTIDDEPPAPVPSRRTILITVVVVVALAAMVALHLTLRS